MKNHVKMQEKNKNVLQIRMLRVHFERKYFKINSFCLKIKN